MVRTGIVLISAREDFVKDAERRFPLFGVDVLATADSMKSAVEKVTEFMPDVVVSDLFVDGDEAASIMKTCRLFMRTLPPFIVISPYVSAALFNECARLGAAYCMLETGDIRLLCERIIHTGQNAFVSDTPTDRFALEKAIDRLLRSLSVPIDCLGYKYLSCAIIMMISDSSLQLTKDIYPYIAKRFQTSDAAVERAIRTAISRAWDGGNFMRQDEIFADVVGRDRGKPTNLQFITATAEFLKYENYTLPKETFA